MTAAATRLIFLLRLLLALLPGAALPAAASPQTDPVAAQKELRQVQDRLKQMQQTLQATQGQRSTAEKALKKAEQTIGASRARLREVTRQQTEAQADLARLETEQQRLEARRRQQQAAIKANLVAAYKSGRQEYVKMLLNEEDPQALSRHLKYYDYVHSARRHKLDAFNQTLQELTRNREQQGQRLVELETLHAELSQQQAQLEQAQADRKASLARLDARLRDSTHQVKQLQANQASLEKVLKAARESLAGLPRHMGSGPFAQLQGKLRWPTRGPLLHRFGSLREDGALRWNGVLIAAGEGSPVQAIAHGRVVFADWMRGFGNLIIIDHGAGYMSLYGQNESLHQSPGDWVSAGDLIARSGNSGGAARPGLYFEIRHRGKPVDPGRWCKG